MNLLKDLWDHIKEWSDWKMKDWIKAAIVAIIVIWVLSWMTGGAAQMLNLIGGLLGGRSEEHTSELPVTQ